MYDLWFDTVHMYFTFLLPPLPSWSPKLTHNGKPWAGPDQFEDSTGKLMMLPTDIVLIQEPSFRKWVEVYAKDEDKFFKVSATLSTLCRFSLRVVVSVTLTAIF